MNISRKDFFRKSLMSLGEAVLSINDALKAPVATPINLQDADNFSATPDGEQVAAPQNENCLAKNSGCFACMERCEPDAIKLIPGVGIRINQQRCNGCGICEYICPVTPKAVKMQARTTTIPESSADNAGLQKKRGESPC